MRLRELISYGFFGVCTTAVNMAVYALLFERLGVPNVPSVIVSWVLSVAFAFITNKLWVFESKRFDRNTLRREVPSFFGARLLTGLLDLAIMYVAVDVCHGNGTLWKLISNAIVIVLNFVASKLVIFKKEQ